MNGELAQLVNLVVSGNAALTGSTVPRWETFAAENLEFVHPKVSRLGSVHRSATAEEAVHRFAREGVSRLSLARPAPPDRTTDDHVTPASANGERTVMIAHGPTPQIWTARWEPRSDAAGPNGTVWQVRYSGQVLPADPPTEGDICGARDRLEDEISRALRFSARLGLQPWEGIFARALDALQAGTPTLTTVPSLDRASNVPLDALQLLAAADRAFVFGGMGSWNDLPVAFEQADSADYQRISTDLYDAVMDAIVAGTNASGTSS